MISVKSFLANGLISVTILVSLILNAVAVDSSFAPDDGFIQVPVYTVTEDIISQNVFDEVFDQDTIDMLTESMNATIDYQDDAVVITQKTKMIPSVGHEVVLYADDQPISVNSDGTIIIPHDTSVVSKVKTTELEKMNSTEYETNISEDFYFFNIDSSFDDEIIFTSSCEDLIARMGENEEKCTAYQSSREARKGYGDKYEPGDWVHCNRFNGPNSDCVHYNWRGLNPAEVANALKNFQGSDCQVALLSGSNCTSIGSCQCNTDEEAAYCSSYTKDARGWNCAYHFHRHTSAALPR